MQIEFRDPQKLKHQLAPALKHFPAISEEIQEQVRASLMQSGQITDPVRLDLDGKVATDQGRTLVLAACALGLKEIAVLPTDLHARTLIIEELCTRRHFTKGAIAYLVYPLLAEEIEAALERQKSCQFPPKVSTKKYSQVVDGMVTVERSTVSAEARTVEELAEEHGIGRTLLREAKAVHELFAEYERKEFNFMMVGGKQDGEMVPSTLRDWFEPRILRTPIGGEHENNRPIGLGGVIAAIGYITSGKNFTSAKRPEHTYISRDFWEKASRSFQAGFRNWDKLPETTKEAAKIQFEAAFQIAPEELREYLLRGGYSTGI